MFMAFDHRESWEHPGELEMGALFDDNDLVAGEDRVCQQLSSMVAREGSSDDNNVLGRIHLFVTVPMDCSGDLLVNGVEDGTEYHSHELEDKDWSIEHLARSFALMDCWSSREESFMQPFRVTLSSRLSARQPVCPRGR